MGSSLMGSFTATMARGSGGWIADEVMVMDVVKGRGAVFVERSTGQWVVRDPEGDFWTLPTVDDPWRHRLPFHPTEDTVSVPVQGLAKQFLGSQFRLPEDKAQTAEHLRIEGEPERRRTWKEGG